MEPINKGDKSIKPIGVSQWAEQGKKCGYWDFFKTEAGKEARLQAFSEVEAMMDVLISMGHGGGNWRDLVTCFLECVKKQKEEAKTE
jgi:hypothetical protein